MSTDESLKIGSDASLKIDWGVIAAPSKIYAAWVKCGCYYETLGQGKRVYPCATHEAAIDALIGVH